MEQAPEVSVVSSLHGAHLKATTRHMNLGDAEDTGTEAASKSQGPQVAYTQSTGNEEVNSPGKVCSKAQRDWSPERASSEERKVQGREKSEKRQLLKG